MSKTVIQAEINAVITRLLDKGASYEDVAEALVMVAFETDHEAAEIAAEQI